MIDDKIWSAYKYGGATLEYKEMLEALNENFRCPRCGRNDLPLALFPAHDKSCRFECGHLIAGAAIDVVEELKQKLEDHEERAERLEMSVRDGLRTIEWFEGWLGKQYPEISYTYRDVAIMKNAMGKSLVRLDGDFRCHSCYGVFDRKFMKGTRCEWCQRHR